MRLSLLFSAALLLATVSAAQAAVPYGSPVFSNATCARGLVCPAEADYDADPDYMSKLVAMANGCVGRNFSLKNSRSLIEDTYGLDSDNCFSTKALPKATTGLTMTPVCCVVPDSGNGEKCQISCTLYGVK